MLSHKFYFIFFKSVYSGKYIIQIYNWAGWKLQFRFNFQVLAFFRASKKISPFGWNSRDNSVSVWAFRSSHLSTPLWVGGDKKHVKLILIIQFSGSSAPEVFLVQHVALARFPVRTGHTCLAAPASDGTGFKCLLRRWQERGAVSLLAPRCCSCGAA